MGRFHNTFSSKNKEILATYIKGLVNSAFKKATIFFSFPNKPRIESYLTSSI